MVTTTVDQQTEPSTKLNSPTFSNILNNKEDKIKEYLPTPVTPAPEFSQFKKDNTLQSAFSTFSVIKPPTPTTSKISTTNLTSPLSEPKPYPCPECHQTFSRPHNLKSHLTTHSSERPFQCDVCNHHFRRHHDLKRHQKLHTGERPHICNDCHRSFARLDALNRHRRAEGGTACSAIQQVNKKMNNNNTSNHSEKSPKLKIQKPNPIHYDPPMMRPIIPQLHIPHPSSHPFPNKENNNNNNNNSNTKTSNNNNIPSPNALPPITNPQFLTPTFHTPSCSSTSSTSPSTASTSPSYHPYQPWSPRYTSRPILPPLSSTSPPPNQPSPHITNEIQSKIDRITQENKELKRDIDQIRAMAQKDANLLRSRIHDLEVENKVLRSLIQPTQQSETDPKESMDEDEDGDIPVKVES